MRVHQVGDGTPEVAVVAAVHGDEPCGVRAVERLLAHPPDVERPAKLVVANERALERGVRFVERDLNRAFPGDPDGDTHETRLAARLLDELGDCTVLALHSTQSHPEPFAVVNAEDGDARRLCSSLPVEAVVETDVHTDGRLIERPGVVEVECGLQGSTAAAENADRLVGAFLRATSVLAADDETGEAGDGRSVRTDSTHVYRLRERIPKPDGERYEVFVRNFEQVPAGERFAAVDGDPVSAPEPFYPVLLSAGGYDDIFGYAADHVDAL